MGSLIEKKKQPKAVSEVILNAMIQHGFVLDVEIVRDWLWRFYGFRINVGSSMGDYPRFTGIVFITPRYGRSNMVKR
jgi:hypothetical protein